MKRCRRKDEALAQFVATLISIEHGTRLKEIHASKDSNCHRSGPGRSPIITMCPGSGSIRGPSWSPPAIRTRSCWPSGCQDWGTIRTTTSYEQIAADPEIDAVIIATPNDTHRPIALACIAGGKHVMCEKPLGLNFDEGAGNVSRGPRQKRAAHDGLHLSIRPLDAVSEASGRFAARWDSAALSQPAVSRFARDELGLAAD